MTTIAICDDAALEREEMLDILENLLPHASIRGFSDPQELLEALEEDWSPMVAVLDIQMEGMNGIHLGRELNRLCPLCRIVFATSHTEYVTDVYDVRHSCFVLKCQVQERLPQAVNRALTEYADHPKLSFRRGRGIQVLPEASVLYLERRLRTTYLCSNQGNFATADHCQEILSRGNPVRFCQCHKSYWVNLSRVRSMQTGWFTLDNGQQIPISRSFQKTAKNQFLSALHWSVEAAMRDDPGTDSLEGIDSGTCDAVGER